MDTGVEALPPHVLKALCLLRFDGFFQMPNAPPSGGVLALCFKFPHERSERTGVKKQNESQINREVRNKRYFKFLPKSPFHSNDNCSE